ncbi:hypothetical protein GGQ20_001517 [Salinibacter ruber]|nr:hypothetical protein [Salinibacter ruber]
MEDPIVSEKDAAAPPLDEMPQRALQFDDIRSVRP